MLLAIALILFTSCFFAAMVYMLPVHCRYCQTSVRTPRAITVSATACDTRTSTEQNWIIFIYPRVQCNPPTFHQGSLLPLFANFATMGVQKDEITPLLQECGYTQICAPVTWAGEPEKEGVPEKTGTILSTAMNLGACGLGASMLSLPYTMMVSGPIVSLELLIFFAIMAFIGAQAVVNAGVRCQKSTYAQIIKHYFGEIEGVIAEVLLAVALIVSAISYIVGLVDLIPDMLPFASHVGRTPRIIAVLMALFPATLISSLATFGPASGIAIAGCYVQAIALVIHLFSGTSDPWSVPEKQVLTHVNFSGVLYSLPTFCFVYAFHYVLTDTVSELRNPSVVRMGKANLSAVAMMVGCYIPVAVAGYLACSGKNIADNVLAGLAPESPPALVAKWAIGGLLFVTYSLFIIPLRRKLEMRLFGSLSTQTYDPRRMAIATAINLFVAYAAVSLSDLSVANALAGGCIALIMFFFPGRLMLRNQIDKPIEERNPLTMAIGGIFTVLGVLISFIGIFGGMIFEY